ncbi:MAG TPA: TerB family tellurite resistance protein [Polyangiaceae bacterium]|nr:TerB family tellurite resistance protein [Polyangiaceae bacterium]
MTPNEKCIVKSLVAVAWADGKVEEVEEHVIEGLLAGFDASEDEEKEILEYAKKKRTLAADIPTADLTDEDKELLLANAALLAHADGEQSEGERELLIQLIKILELDDETASSILDSVKDGALQLGSNVLESVE